MNPLMNSVGSNAEGKLNCINAVVITHTKRIAKPLFLVVLWFFFYFLQNMQKHFSAFDTND